VYPFVGFSTANFIYANILARVILIVKLLLRA